MPGQLFRKSSYDADADSSVSEMYDGESDATEIAGGYRGAEEQGFQSPYGRR